MLESPSPDQIRSAEKTLSVGTWAITAGAVLFSVLTVTPLVERVTPDGWDRTAPILPLVVDTAVVIVVRLDATVARLGGSSGAWPAVLRWMTGLMTLLLNVGDSALNGDTVGVAVHSVAPLLLIATAEAGLAYRRAINRAVENIERSRAAERAEREQQQRADREHERSEHEQRERSEREHAERLDRERAEREASERAAEREHTAALERERLDREAEIRREQREHEDRVRREEQQRADAVRREQQERAERSRREQQAREQAAHTIEQTGDETAVNTAGAFVNTAVNGTPALFTKMPEGQARSYIRSFREGEKSVRQLAEDTGWSVGWVAARIHDRDAEGEPAEAVA
ncbi:DUF2637 domain-containing protein [Streptomyces triticiradicis]|uniref:DUF2637 domain-containing protein n=1 Tax=Streptomyces triticiradicis TaxID=2651189 RepID=A0A7J5D9H7_9ACTN|nr:DUF2637 domain-containing protein [Streptomyces triticiradicis]KAB1983418.1 DUF2637 domain-containing protein [Streptomyces triticiradicis]